ncbi:MAG: DUF4190 domain-containing protein [Salinibacterium sp.]|nr:DUF4190 domain-containing protein [Salinibacterium sp.]
MTTITNTVPSDSLQSDSIQSDSLAAIDDAASPAQPVSPRTQPILAILSLVFGITGIVTTMIFPFSVVGLVLGILALGREPQARVMAIWGTVISGIPGALIVLVGELAVMVLIPLGFIAAL